MKQVPRRFTAPQTVPWCTCTSLGRPAAYRQHPEHEEEFFVHAQCLKPSRMYWEVRVAGRSA